MPIPEELTKTDKNRVLIVDDDPKILKMIKTILSGEEELEVATANSGFHAGALIYQWLPDIILLDLLMPEMDGFEVCRQLRSNDKTKDITVIALTVLKDPKDIKKMHAAGITDYLSKPFKSEELIKRVKAHLLIE